MKNAVVAALLMVLATAICPAQAQAQPQAPEPVAGKDFVEIPNGSPLDRADDTIAVEEFFNYICPACNGFEPLFVAWTAKLPSYAKVVHIPATFRADFMLYARAYYAAETLGLVDKTHRAVYDAIHVSNKLPGEGENPSEERVAAFYADFGVDKDEFLSTMHSFGVELKLKRATEHMTKSKVPSTPTLVINGRYLVRGDSYADMLRIASYLVEKEHAR